MKPSYLKNGRIFLRAIEPDDLDFVYEMENDPEMWNVSSFIVPYSRHVVQEYILNSQTDIFADKQLRLMIVDYVGKKTVGSIDLTDFSPLDSRAGVGIAIHSKYRGKGYAYEALTLMCEYAFEFLSIHQLYAYVAVDNHESKELFLKAGFKNIAILTEWIKRGENYKDICVMQQLNKMHI